ncbi:anthrone oxygenase family protein [Actinomycetospora cinnamomea]|uniref:Putative membrane protein n=1 Tax=Actinomycetospora cinnamomea TaxID=663609 RepID=A0A2U1FSB9_9PSEU|nr:anthrone oxygenase family protein [Actinomycetospora cinnamomea]PVZ14950.1 putative membrane protein [Actinomycetospora cinnamomea]
MTVLVPAVVLVAGALSALLAGLYLAFSLTIMPALARMPDRVLVTVMQAVNRVILRPAFLLLFLGAPLTAVAAVVLLLVHGAPATSVVLAGVGGVLQVASLVMTVVVHVPRNEALDRADPDDADDVVRAREAFERPWTRAHRVRATITTMGALALLAA